MAKGSWPLSPDVAGLRSRSLKLDDLHPRTALTDDTASDDRAATSCCDDHPELCKSMDPQPPARMEVVAFHAPGMYGATPDSWKVKLLTANCVIIAQFPIENHSEQGQFAEVPLKP